jgi:hypothetical protein
MTPTLSVSATVIVGVPAAILLAGYSKGIDFVIADSGRDISITGSPVEGAIHDRWPIDY